MKVIRYAVAPIHPKWDVYALFCNGYIQVVCHFNRTKSNEPESFQNWFYKFYRPNKKWHNCWCLDYFRANEVNYIESIFLIFFIIVGLLYIIENYINSINFISEIRIDKEKITLIGYEFNTKWEEEIDIQKTEIKIKSKTRGRFNIHYLLRLTCEKEVYDINKLFNWDYFTIVEIYKEFKNIKEEKIILDEKFILDNVLNKAKGLSP